MKEILIFLLTLTLLFPASRSIIRLESHDIDAQLVLGILDRKSAGIPSPYPFLEDSDSIPLIIQLQSNVTPAAVESFLPPGTSLSLYLPDNSYLVSASYNQVENTIQHIPAVAWIGYWEPQYKISRSLGAEWTETWRPRQMQTFFRENPFLYPLNENSDSVDLVVSLLPKSPRDQDGARLIAKQLAALLHVLSGKLEVPAPIVRIATIDRLIVELNDGAIDAMKAVAREISKHPVVYFVERKIRPKFLNRWARGILERGMNVTADYRERIGLISWDYSLEGQSQVFGLADSGIDLESCFFSSGQVIMKEGFADDRDSTGHGTHVAGTLVGYLDPDPDHGTRPSFTGMAPRARLAVMDVGLSDGRVILPDDLDESLLGKLQIKGGASIQVIAWGSSVPLYTSEARDVDAYLHKNRHATVVIAAGNDGACYETTTITSPASSKNGISVGASMSNAMAAEKTGLHPLPRFLDGSNQVPLNENDIASFSSRGPTLDGRTKPDLVAPGYFIYSANTGAGDNSCSSMNLGSLITPNAGTSMAVSVLAGGVALIRQYLMEGYHHKGDRDFINGIVPSGSLLKAAAIASGKPLVQGQRFASDEGINEPSRCDDRTSAKTLDYKDYGWGRIQLDRILWFSDDRLGKPMNGDESKYGRDNDALSFNIVGRNNKSIHTLGDPELGHGEVHRYTYCVHARQLRNRPVRIVLAWTDPPATLGAKYQLVNDLDLEVMIGSDKLPLQADRLNPVEVIDIDSTKDLEKPVNLQISIHAHRIAIGTSQSYSVVLSGLASTGRCPVLGEADPSVTQRVYQKRPAKEPNTPSKDPHLSTSLLKKRDHAPSIVSHQFSVVAKSDVLTIFAATIVAIAVAVIALKLLQHHATPQDAPVADQRMPFLLQQHH